MAERIQLLMSAERRLLLDISHELRSPLARLSVAIELARMGEDLDSHLNRIQKEADRLNALVGELLQVTRAEGDASRLRSQQVRLNELIAAIVDDGKIEAEARGCGITFHPSQEVTVAGDPELLRRAIENVVRNGIRYSPTGKHVEVGLATSPHRATIEVRDYGPGVPEESLTRLFDAFYRVEPDRDRASGGVGLGLAIARRAIELHHGHCDSSQCSTRAPRSYRFASLILIPKGARVARCQLKRPARQPASGKDYSFMGNLKWTARRKLFASLIVLAVVFVIATIAQFTGKNTRQNPYAATRETATPPPRAVFGGDPRPSPTTPQVPDARTDDAATRARTATDESAADRASIDQFLQRWRDTVAKGDLEGQTELYAPMVSRFFRQRNVSNDAVRKVKSQMMSLYPTVNKYEISDVKVESNNGSEAVVSFRKEWDMDGKKRFAGAERQRLRLRRIGGDWRIVTEEETKVYWTKRS